MAEKLGEIAVAANKTIAIETEKPNIALTVKYSKPVDFKIVGAETKNGNLSLGNQNINEESILASANIPGDTFKNKSQIVHSFLFRNDALFQTENLQKNGQKENQLSSNILAVSVGKEKIENLTSPIQLNFKKKRIYQKESQTVDNVCTFWDPTVCKFFKI